MGPQAPRKPHRKANSNRSPRLVGDPRASANTGRKPAKTLRLAGQCSWHFVDAQRTLGRRGAAENALRSVLRSFLMRRPHRVGRASIPVRLRAWHFRPSSSITTRGGTRSPRARRRIVVRCGSARPPRKKAGQATSQGVARSSSGLALQAVGRLCARCRPWRGTRHRPATTLFDTNRGRRRLDLLRG